MIPLLIVSGFLGSGKTTLIRSILADPGAGDVAVIVNEFGEVGIDHHLLSTTVERTTLLRNGCVCCSLRDDLVETLRDLLSRRDRGLPPPFSRVILETTGLADPAPILRTLVDDPVIRHHYRLERLVVTVDALNGEANLAHFGEALRQIAAADTIVITKRDLAPAVAVQAIERGIRRLNPAATVVTADFGRVELDRLLDEHDQHQRSFLSGQADSLDGSSAATIHAVAGRVTSRCLTLDQTIDWPMFGVWLTMLLHRHGERVLRLKGLLSVGADSGPLLLEGVQHVLHAPRHLPAWPEGDADGRQSRLVVIVRDLEIDQIAASLIAFQQAAETT